MAKVLPAAWWPPHTQNPGPTNDVIPGLEMEEGIRLSHFCWPSRWLLVRNFNSCWFHIPCKFMRSFYHLYSCIFWPQKYAIFSISLLVFPIFVEHFSAENFQAEKHLFFSFNSTGKFSKVPIQCNILPGGLKQDHFPKMRFYTPPPEIASLLDHLSWSWNHPTFQ